MFLICLHFDYIINKIWVIQYNYIKVSYFFVFGLFLERSVNVTAKSLKQFNSLDDRGIFCTEVHAKDRISHTDSAYHRHDSIEIIYSVDAKIEIKTEFDKFLISSGELIVISPMEQHAQSILGAGLYYSVRFLPGILFSSDQTFSEYKFFNRFISLEGTKRQYSKTELETINAGSIFSDIMREWSHKASGYELMIRANILKIFTFLARCDNSVQNAEKHKYTSDAINSALSYISENSATATEQTTAEHCGLSLTYFSTLFKNTVGMKFGEYLMQLKVGRAKALLLTTDKSITYIAYETGFASSSHFIARFREIEGTTPAKYRRRIQTEGAVNKIKAPAFTAIFPEVGQESGHLLIFKYRTNRLDNPPFVPLFVSTKSHYPISDDLSWTLLNADEQWHVIIMDIERSKQYVKSFIPDKDGKFYGSHAHFHLFYKIRSPDQYVDLAFVSYAKNLGQAFDIIGRGEDISLGYFDDDGFSRWETLPIDFPDGLSDKEIPQKFYRDAKNLFNDASANGISLRKVELLHEGNVEFTRIWCP